MPDPEARDAQLAPVLQVQPRSRGGVHVRGTPPLPAGGSVHHLEVATAVRVPLCRGREIGFLVHV